MEKHNPPSPSIMEVPDEHHFDRKGLHSTVADKYRGTAADQHDMKVLNRAQVLRRNFRLPTMLGFASTVLVGETLGSFGDIG